MTPTTSTTPYERGDIALVRFLFADEQGAKQRPVLVLSGGEYHAGRQEVIVAALTSNVSRLLPGDHLIEEWKDAGLPKPSVATGILRTIKRTMIGRVLGRMTARDLSAYQKVLRKMLGLQSPSPKTTPSSGPEPASS
ncbi:MAG: type II toxin-antitoxin system PemK/MazF family toxin [Candidatus Binatia bacterium]